MSEKGEQSVAVSTGVKSSVLVGRFDHALDPKKRFTIPSEWRAAMGNPEYVYVMPDPHKKCLNLIPAIEMEMRLEKLREKALFDPQCSQALQVIGANTDQLTLDVQGRIRVRDKLLQFANLTTTVAMVGSVRKVEIWSPAALDPEGTVDQAALATALSEVAF